MKTSAQSLSRIAIGVFAILMGCYRGEFLAGQHCESHDECGPHLMCKNGYCGDRNVGAGGAGSAAEGSTANTDKTTINATGSTMTNCGNKQLDNGEDCDGPEFSSNETCKSVHYSGGSIHCNEHCKFDYSHCFISRAVFVKEGTFWMGSSISEHEGPLRQVYVDDFWIDEMEIVVVQYSDCVADGACSEPESGSNCNWHTPGRDNHPINCVTWFQAKEFCSWSGGRLPTEAEWEKATRGTSGQTYPWGNVPAPNCKHVVMADYGVGGPGCGTGSTMEVGSRPLSTSPYGAQDMAGNVSEWVADRFGPYNPEETNNPRGEETGALRVLRGGSWEHSNTSFLRAAYRVGAPPSIGLTFAGFRCVRTSSTSP